MEHANFEIVKITDAFVLIRGLRKGCSITTDVHSVIDAIKHHLDGQLHDRRIYYRDRKGHFDEIVLKDGAFLCFAPCTVALQSLLIRHFGDRRWW